MKIDALLKQLSVSALVVGFVVSCGGDPVKDEEAPVAEETTQADPAQASAKQAIADAYAALDEAKAVGAEWRDTGKYLKKAQAAYDAGDYAKAEKIANAMKLQSENAVSQQQAEAAKFEPATSFDEEQTSATVTTDATDASNDSESINGITSYTVVKGDTLWGIASRDDVYANPYEWPLIYKANASIINDPDLIFPDQVFDINQNPLSEEVEAAISHARNRGAWSLGVAEDSDAAYLAQ